MPGRFETATDPTERAMQRLQEAIQREAQRGEVLETGDGNSRPPRLRRKRELTLVVTAVVIMTLAFILLLFWLR